MGESERPAGRCSATLDGFRPPVHEKRVLSARRSHTGTGQHCLVSPLPYPGLFPHQAGSMSVVGLSGTSVTKQTDTSPAWVEAEGYLGAFPATLLYVAQARGLVPAT